MSYGKATPYFPVIDLLKRYAHVEEHDDLRTIRAKVTGQVVTLDAALQDTGLALLSLLDALPDDSPFLQLDPPQGMRPLQAYCHHSLGKLYATIGRRAAVPRHGHDLLAAPGGGGAGAGGHVIRIGEGHAATPCSTWPNGIAPGCFSRRGASCRENPASTPIFCPIALHAILL